MPKKNSQGMNDEVEAKNVDKLLTEKKKNHEKKKRHTSEKLQSEETPKKKLHTKVAEVLERAKQISPEGKLAHSLHKLRLSAPKTSSFDKDIFIHVDAILARKDSALSMQAVYRVVKLICTLAITSKDLVSPLVSHIRKRWTY